MVKVSKAWIPSAFNGIQYNTCKNPKCENYGLDPEIHPKAYVITYGGKATLHGVDSFFEKVRRRISLFERAVRSSANDGRTWNGYSAYNPAMVGKLLDIFRVVHNYIDVRKKDGITTTAAMRLGLANAPLSYKDVLYYE